MVEDKTKEPPKKDPESKAPTMEEVLSLMKELKEKNEALEKANNQYMAMIINGLKDNTPPVPDAPPPEKTAEERAKEADEFFRKWVEQDHVKEK